MKTKNEWLDDMELRLKRALLDVADSREGEGQRFLQQEIASHLEDVNGDAVRLDYLVRLRERFPQLHQHRNADAVVGTDVGVDAGSVDMDAAPPDEPVAVSVEQAMEIVCRDWEQVDEASQQTFLSHFISADESNQSDELPDVTPAPRVVEAMLEEPSDEFARFLKLPEATQLSLERVQSVLISLLKSVAQVDSLGTQVYKQVGLSRELNPEDIRKLVGQYISGTSVEVDHLNRVLDETRLKVGLIISSIADLSASLSNSHLSKFQPSLIEQSVGNSGGFLANTEAKCWKKYVALSEDIQPQKIEKAINNLMVKQLKKLKRR